MRKIVFAALVACLASNVCWAQEAANSKPLFRDFVGINGHTVQFKPELYKQVCSVVRDYHPMEWDTGPDTNYPLDFPFARNRVNWEQVYGSWRRRGFFNDVCIMVETVSADQWKALDKDSFYYGKRFAEHFGPSSRSALVDAVEVGNEPGKFDDAQYRTVFENMARGLREGDPKLLIATCNVNVGKSGDYHKSVDCVAGLEKYYDVLNIHSYAMLDGWPTWTRSYPEDERLPAFTQDIDKLIAWRNEHAPGKPIWLTEFGWDCSTQKPDPSGDWGKWRNNSDLEQAQWLVRSFFLFAKRDVQRAFIYFFNDDDTPQFHGSSGITRKFEPKPSFYAVAHMNKTLGDYRFSRIIRETKDDCCVYEFQHEKDPKTCVWVAWSPTGSQRITSLSLPAQDVSINHAERMPLTKAAPERELIEVKNGEATFAIGESPIYLFVKNR